MEKQKKMSKDTNVKDILSFVSPKQLSNLDVYKRQTQSSYGADFIFDWNVLRMSYPLTTGVRLIKPIDYGNFQAEMLFSVTF